ncbi:hypothetical protein MVEN_02380300 [Mycena venus]|uniref:Uncharacterized protein n=1 Tax=Mycena venus TaxID=2733690 RepID=A0A8H7CE34_9AGAR|nr:hypothetical protein MVEN_02380300 [Mycena venus]
MSPLPSNIVPHILAGVVRNTVPGGRRQTFKWWSSSDVCKEACDRYASVLLQASSSQPAQFYHCASDLLPLSVNWGQAAAAVISSEPLISYLALHRTPPRTPSTSQFGAVSSSELLCPAPHPAENAVHATIRSRDFVRAVDFLPCPALHLAENAVHATIRLNTISNVRTAVNVLLDIAVGAVMGIF